MKFARALALSLLVCSLAGAQTPLPQAAALMPMGKQQFLNANGKPLAGGLIYSYAAGTTTPQATYSDSTAATPNANPVVLDAGGRASIWLGASKSYKIVAQDALGVTQWTADNVNEPGLYYASQLQQYLLTLPLGQAVSVKQYGAKGDGVTNDTAAIQSAINSGAGTIYFPAGTYEVLPPANGGALVLPSNVTLVMTGQTTIQAMSGFHDDPGANHLIDIVNADNVVIEGNGAKLTMPKAFYTSGEQRHAISVQQSSNVKLKDLYISGTGGDGVTIGGALGGGGTASRNVTVANCHIDNARRNGISVTHGINIQILNSEITNTSGTTPEAGIDIEPDPNETIQNVLIQGVRTSGNAENGIDIVPNFMAAAAGSIYNLDIRDYVSFQDGSSSHSTGLYFAVQAGDVASYPVAGKITVDNATIIQPWTTGVAFTRWHAMLPPVILRNVTVLNPNYGATSYDPGATGWSTGEATVAANSGFVIGTAPGQIPTTYTGHVELYNCLAEDTNGSHTMNLGFYLHAGGSGAVGIDAYLKDPLAINYTLSGTSAVNWNTGVGNVEYSNRPVMTVSTSNFNTQPYIGYEFQATTPLTLLLGTAAQVKGAKYYFRNTISTGFTVSPGASDTVDIYGLAAGQTFTVATSGRGLRALSLTADGANTWKVNDLSSYYASNGPLYIVDGYGSAPNNGNALAIGSMGTSPNYVSFAWGSGTGAKLNFGYHNGTSFVPGAWITDTGLVNSTGFYANGAAGVTVSGTSCTVKAITAGIITSATCP